MVHSVVCMSFCPMTIWRNKGAYYMFYANEIIRPTCSNGIVLTSSDISRSTPITPRIVWLAYKIQ